MAPIGEGTLGKEDAQELSLAQAFDVLARALDDKPTAPSSPRWLNSLKSTVERLRRLMVVFARGYYYIQNAAQDLNHPQFTVSSAHKGKSYVGFRMTASCGTPGDQEKLNATDLVLSGFGGVTASPLSSIIDVGRVQRPGEVKFGLKHAARVVIRETCPILATDIDDKTGVYEWSTQKAVAEIAGLAGCCTPSESLNRGIST